MQGTVDLKIKLEACLRQDENVWVAWCPSVDVFTQADTQGMALDALREAVYLWFESCIDRGVLPQALEEAGFQPASAGEEMVPGANPIHVPLTSERGAGKIVTQEVEVFIPAYFAAA